MVDEEYGNDDDARYYISNIWFRSAIVVSSAGKTTKYNDNEMNEKKIAVDKSKRK